MDSQGRRDLIIPTLVFVIVTGVCVQRGLHKGGAFEEGRTNDFWAYHVAARAVWERDLTPSYHEPTRPNLYPPTFAILTSFLGLLPYRAAVVVWALLGGVALVLIFRGLESILAVPLPPLAKTAGLLLAFRPLESDFSNGNANLIVLGLVLGAIALARRGREVAGGVTLAAAILSKVSPVLILPWLIYRGRWRMLAGVVAGAVILGAAVPVAVLGPHRALDAWSAWHEVTLEHVTPTSESYAEMPASGYEPGQSLRAFLHRMLRHSDATAHDGEVRSVNLLDLPKGAVDAMYLAAALLILGGALIACRRRAPGRRLGWRPEEVAAACAAMVLLAPLSRKAHFVALWPAAVLGFEAWRRSEGSTRRAVGAALWFLALLLVVGSSPGVLGREASTLLLAYCPFGWAAACLLVLVVVPSFFPRGDITVAEIGRQGPSCPVLPPSNPILPPSCPGAPR